MCTADIPDEEAITVVEDITAGGPEVTFTAGAATDAEKSLDLLGAELAGTKRAKRKPAEISRASEPRSKRTKLASTVAAPPSVPRVSAAQPSVQNVRPPAEINEGARVSSSEPKASKERKSSTGRASAVSFMDDAFDREDARQKKKSSKKSKKHKKTSKKARSSSSSSGSSYVSDRKKRGRKQKKSSSSDSGSSVGSSVVREASVDLKGRDWASMKARAERYPGRMAMYLLQSFGNQVGRDGVPHQWGRRETPACAQAYFNRVITGQGVGCFPPSQKRDRREAQTLCLMLDLSATGRCLGWTPF